MAGYLLVAMVRTPWGDAQELRSRMLAPGPGIPAEERQRNQRERLFAAMVATVAEKGYKATTVNDLVGLSGVSRSAFYNHFGDKLRCFIAAADTLMESTIEFVIESGRDLPEGETRGRGALRTFIELIVAQPAAARMCFVEIYAAGQEAVESVHTAMGAFERYVGAEVERIPGRAGMPDELVRAMIGGMRRVIDSRLYRGGQDELKELADPLADWAISYRPPPEGLRVPRRRPVPPAQLDGHDAAERVLHALTTTVIEQGYPQTTVADVARRGSISQRTFYAHFGNKEEAMLAALDAGSARMVAAVMPAYRRAADWPRAVRAALEAMLTFGAAEPEYTRLGTESVHAVGPPALEQRDRVMTGLQALLEPGFELAPQTPAVAAEAIAGAIYSLIYDRVVRDGPEGLPQLAPLATYVALCPFLGPEEACGVANGDGRRR